MTAKLTEGSSNRSEDSKAGSTTTSRKVRLLVSVFPLQQMLSCFR
jgi:hypothetical protein